MSIRKIIKPTISKIALFVILVILSVVIPFEDIMGSWVADGPIFNYERIICGGGGGPLNSDLCGWRVYWGYVVFNIGFYYLLSCSVIGFFSSLGKLRK